MIRYRCTACGNLTRFDVTVSRRTRAFHHYTVGGELAVEEEHVLSEAVEEVACRWCGHGRAVEVVAPGEGESPARGDQDESSGGGDQGERPGPTPAEEQVI